MDSDSISLHVEINLKVNCTKKHSFIEKSVEKYFNEQQFIIPNKVLTGVILPEFVNFVRVCEVNDKLNSREIPFPSENINLHYYVYVLTDDIVQVESLCDENEEVPTSDHWILPNTEFEGLWENLVYEDDLKNDLIKYVKTAMHFAQNKVCPKIICWNSVVLLHGPPGTGKTSLCKALAQKLSIRLSSTFTSGQLIEINTHSLFSKWFSESGKLVMKMFQKIGEWCTDSNSFVCVLIDEVESLTYGRKCAINGSEPSDSIRVVNAVLTQIDQLKRFPNVLVLATSNVTCAIDIAFADRADIKRFIGNPSKWSIYHILKTCMDELIQAKLVAGKTNELLDKDLIMKLSQTADNMLLREATMLSHSSEKLLKVARQCEGLSGRTLRKLPLLTAANFNDSKTPPNVLNFLAAMEKEVINISSDNMEYYKSFGLKDEKK